MFNYLKLMYTCKEMYICEESWAPKSWCFWTVVPEKTLESPLDCKEIIPVNPKGNQPWIFIGRTDVGKDWEQEEKGATEDEMVGWHQGLNEHEFEQTPGDGEVQGSLVCCSLWCYKASDRTAWLNNILQPEQPSQNTHPIVSSIPLPLAAYRM